MKKPPPSRPRSESFEQYNGWGPFYRQILRAHISAPPQKTLLPIARRTVRFRRPVLHVQGGTRREKTFGQQAGLVLARRRRRHLRCSVRPEPDLQQSDHGCRRVAGARGGGTRRWHADLQHRVTRGNAAHAERGQLGRELISTLIGTVDHSSHSSPVRGDIACQQLTETVCTASSNLPDDARSARKNQAAVPPRIGTSSPPPSC